MKQIKQIFMLCLLWMVGMSASAEIVSGDCGANGDNVIWSLDTETGMLVISGEGKMKDYFSYSTSPWYSNKSTILSVQIDDGVTSIGDYAFYYCSSLTSINIPNSVTSIGNSAFTWCSGLASITVEDGNTCYDSREGCNAIIEKSTNELVVGCKNTIIPNSVTSIGNSAFIVCSALTSIEIPNSVTSIGNYAFDGCSALTSIEIPNSVTTIGNYAFSGCSALTSIEIPNSVTRIRDHTFAGCSSLTSIEIPNSVTSIRDYAFSGCSALTSIEIPNSVTSILERAFYGCSSLTSIEIPNSVATIASFAFSGCSRLTSVEISNSVTYIGNNAFGGCSSLMSINVESNNPIFDSRENCNAIIMTSTNTLIYGCTNTIIPNSVTSIGDYAFNYCSSLTSINIPNSVTSIGNSAFYAGLKELKVNWVRPLSVAANAFYGLDKSTCVLYVPKGTSAMYMAAPVWIDFKNIQEFAVDEEQMHYITIKQAESGVVKQVAELGKTYQYLFEPADGWEVNSVTYNGNDVTWLLDNGMFATPVITGDVELSVVFRQGGDDINSPTSSSVKLTAASGTVTISGANESDKVAIYSTSGILVKSAQGNGQVSLDSDGVYIIKVGDETFKVRM